jgi:organic hydroperoxide reductase OsmC/OhrA
MAHEYHATIEWKRAAATFTDNKYSRGHVWRFDGGVEVPGSSAPSSVPFPYSVAAAVDPEEALVAATSSCHMLFFLYFAAKEGFVVDLYVDDAIGSMSKNDGGKLYVSQIVLRPDVTFSGAKQPSAHDLEVLHHRAHEECYIANSVKAEIIVRPRGPGQA